MSTPATPTAPLMERLVSLCKRRGFVYPASEIYGGINGFWDYGPLGVLLKNNIRDHWWRTMVLNPPIGPDGEPVEIVGLDSSIIQNPKAWVASGHVGGFSDPMVDDRDTKQRFRADHLWGVYLYEDGALLTYSESFVAGGRERASKEGAAVLPIRTMVGSSAAEAARSLATDKAYRRLCKVRDFEFEEASGPLLACRIDLGDGLRDASIMPVHPNSLAEHASYIPSPYSGKTGALTEPRAFNLMFQTYVGALASEDTKAYLRPETAQGIFLNFKNVLDTTRVKVPFGVAQVGKSFRNEVTPRNFIFRSREFEQMEMEFFCAPDEALKWYGFWREERMKWWLSLGVDPKNLRFRDHDEDELSHYSKATVDIEYLYPFTAPDFGELEGVAHRGCFDLTQHAEHSKTKLDYFDQELQLKLKEEGASAEEIKAKSRYVPNVIEPASGLTRAVLVMLCEFYRHEPGRQGTEEYFSFPPQFAPVKLGIFPLVNKDGMPELAQKIYLDLRGEFTCEYDPKQSIGKRYARMDEVGTPFCVTVDGDTTTGDTVTVRHRDSMQQERINVGQLKQYLRDKLS